MFVLVGCISRSASPFVPRSTYRASFGRCQNSKSLDSHSHLAHTRHTPALTSHSRLSTQTCGPPPPIAFACRARLSASVLYVPPMGESETSGDGSVLIIGDAPIPGVASGAE